MAMHRGWNEDQQRKELPVNDQCRCCLALSDRIMELEDIAHPQSAAFSRVRDHFRLTVREASLLMALLRFKRGLSKEELMTLTYPAEATRPELKIIDVFMCKLRHKLPKELHPRTDWGMGYRLDSAARRGLQAIANGGEQSDGGAEDDKVIDFRLVRAAALGAIAEATPGPPIVNIEAVKRRVTAIGPVLDGPIEAAALWKVRRTATAILAG